MAIDYPRAWQIANAVTMRQHHPRCSFRRSGGGLLCDCNVLKHHPEYNDKPLHTTDGKIIKVQYETSL
jgi:hypothetical protein